MLKTFDTYGLSPSFIEAYDTMDIKGVQLETLGFLSTSHALKWAYFTQYSTFHNKLYKYLAANARDLSGAKVLGMGDFNFESVENFIEYESFLADSYFVALVVEVVEKAKNSVTALSSQQPFEDVLEVLGN